MYVQSMQLIQPFFLQDSSSFYTPITCELVSDNGYKWSKDEWCKASKSHFQMSDVIRKFRKLIGKTIEKSSIVYD